MRILLLNPPSGNKRLTHFPLGLCYLKAYLKKQGIASRVLDASAMDEGEIRLALDEHQPDLLGITCFTNTRFGSFRTADMAREMFGGKVKIVLGGAHATHLYEQVLLNYPSVDCVALGEGEQTLVDMAKSLGADEAFRRVPGTAHRVDGNRVAINECRPFIENLDDVPFPDYDDLKVGEYHSGHAFTKGSTLFSVIASRSCAYSCAFCSTRRFWGKLRIRSVENVLGELRWLAERYGARHFIFEDDAITLNERWSRELCEGILRDKMDFTWCAQTRADSLTRETALMLKKAGCCRLCFGVESGSPTILKNLNKRQRVEDVVEAFRVCKEVGLLAAMSLIIGSPGEDATTLQETRNLLARTNPEVIGVNVLRIYPGTTLFDLAKSQKLLDDSVFLTPASDLRYTGSLSDGTLYWEQLRLLFFYHVRLNGICGAWRMVCFLLGQFKTNPRALRGGLPLLARHVVGWLVAWRTPKRA